MTVLGKPMERMQWMKMCLIRTALKAIAELAHALQQQVEQHACALNHSFRIIQNMTAQFNFDREFASSYGMTYEGSANTRSRDCGCAAGDVEEVEANQDVPSIEETARLHSSGIYPTAPQRLTWQRPSGNMAASQKFTLSLTGG